MKRSTTTSPNSLVAAPLPHRLLLLWPLWLVLLSAPGLRAQDVLTYHNDNARSGLNPAESTLTPANVNSTEFGLLFTLSVDGLVDAQPLFASGVVFANKAVHDVLIVATEHDIVYAFDAVDGALLWQASVLLSGETTSDDRGCGQVSPEIGITSTPVIDRSSGPHGTVYVVAMSKDSSGNYHQRLHALDLTTKAEEFGGPMEILAKYPGTGDNSINGYVIFDPAQYKERPGLLLLNHVIYTGWSSHCDDTPYTGWLIGYNESTLAQTTVLNIIPNGSEGAIWQAGGGLAADSGGYIYFLDGNGTFDTTLDAQGFPSQGDYGNAFMKLSTAGGKLSVADYFTMSNTVDESDGDVDLGSGGAMLLPDMIDATGRTRQLAVGAGKDSNIYLADRNNMGKFNPNTDNIYQELDGALPSGEWASPANFNGTLYYGGVSDYLKAFQFSNARLSASPTSQSAITFTYPGATPSVSANGTRNGIVWATENTYPAVLHAYDATNLANELYNTNQAPNGRDQFGSGNKFIAPMISHGRVYVGTTSGVGVFGLLPAATSVAPASLGFGIQVVGGTSAAQAVALSNPSGSGLSLTSITASAGFAQTNNCPSSLAAGGNCSISVMFSPSAPGPGKGTVTIVASVGGPQTVSVAGVGTTAKLDPASLSFSSQTVGTSSGSQTITLTNKAAVAMRLFQIAISGANASNFSKTAACGVTLGTGASCTVAVAFTPTAAGPRTASVLFSDDGGGSPQRVAVSGTGVAPSVKPPLKR
ncbi:MAG: choice-of-anchor D domain-containing protein [Terriglobia bacterium]